MTALDDVITNFQAISLAQIEQVRLMNRTDRKYWFDSSLLPELLMRVKDDYYLLEIKGQRNQPYATMYFDTQVDEMYNNHHRGKKNRYKIRKRQYVLTGESFLEVKFKSNKGRTIKHRINSDYPTNKFTLDERNFIRDTSPYSCDELCCVLENSFSRLMLVSKSLDERCTIDTALSFSVGENHKSLDSLVVVEVKTNGHERSHIIEALSQMRIKPSSFSKYCVGRSLIEQQIKINRFKKIHRKIKNVSGEFREFAPVGY